MGYVSNGPFNLTTGCCICLIPFVICSISECVPGVPYLFSIMQLGVVNWSLASLQTPSTSAVDMDLDPHPHSISSSMKKFCTTRSISIRERLMVPESYAVLNHPKTSITGDWSTLSAKSRWLNWELLISARFVSSPGVKYFDSHHDLGCWSTKWQRYTRGPLKVSIQISLRSQRTNVIFPCPHDVSKYIIEVFSCVLSQYLRWHVWIRTSKCQNFFQGLQQVWVGCFIGLISINRCTRFSYSSIPGGYLWCSSCAEWSTSRMKHYIQTLECKITRKLTFTHGKMVTQWNCTLILTQVNQINCMSCENVEDTQ